MSIKLFLLFIFLILVTTEYFKKRFKLDGWQVNGVAFLIGLVLSLAYLVVKHVVWYEVILWTIVLFISACGAFDLLKELFQWIGIGVHKRRRAVVSR